jgi:hypothetical protein
MKDIKGFFLRNYKAKISVFVISVCLWAFITTSTEYNADFNIPVKIVGRKSSKVLVDPIPQTITVQGKDTGRKLLMFQFFSDAYLRLDISSINYFYDYPLGADQIYTPGGFYPKQLQIVSPDSIMIRLDDLERARVPIISRVTVIPKPGFVLVSRPKLSQDSVTISGARRFVRSVRSVPTDSVAFESVNGSFQTLVPLKAPAEGLEYGIKEVEVTATADRLGQIVVQDVPVYITAIPVGRQVVADPPQVDITVRGAVSLLRSLRSDSVQAVINFRQVWKSDVRSYIPQVKLPNGVELIAIAPAQVHLNVKKTG